MKAMKLAVVACVLALVGCGGLEETGGEMGGVTIQMHSNLAYVLGAAVNLTNKADGEIVRVILYPDTPGQGGGTFTGSDDEIPAGLYSAQLRIHFDGGWDLEDYGDPVDVEIIAGATAKLVMYYASSDEQFVSPPRITTLTLNKAKVDVGETLTATVALNGGVGPYTVSGTAPADAGTFAPATGSGTSYSLVFTAGTKPGDYPLVFRAADSDDNADEVSVEIEVEGPAGTGPGAIDVELLEMAAPVVDYSTVREITATELKVQLVFSATASGEASGKELDWSVSGCSGGSFTVGGQTTSGSASGTMADKATITATFVAPRAGLAGFCSIDLGVKDSNGAETVRFFNIPTAAPSVNTGS